MRPVAKKVKVMCLQEQHCQTCTYNAVPPEYCMIQCEVGKELIKLNKEVFQKRRIKTKTPEEKWDERCKQAVMLCNKGMLYPVIAKKIGCHVSHLYRELKKRGLFQIPKASVSKTRKLRESDDFYTRIQ